MGSYKLLLPRSFVALLALSAADAWSSATPVLWVEEVNVIAAEDNETSDPILYKAGGCDGCSDAGAVSRQEIVSGDGYIQFTVSSTDGAYYAGLSKGNADTSVADIDFSFSISGAIAEVRENGVYKYDTTVSVNDVLSVRSDAGVVKYYKNGEMFYQSAMSPAYPLVFDASLLGESAEFSNALISTSSDGIWTDIVHVASYPHCPIPE